MGNLITKPTELSQKLLSEYVSEGDVVVDATAGNGNDTLALAGLVGKTGKVYAFDIQETAIRNTKVLLERGGFSDRCQLILESHHLMRESIPEKDRGRVSAVVFNLGYLPGGEKTKTTLPGTTLQAVQTALELIRPGGIVAVTMYAGHPEGAEEKMAMLRFAEALSSSEYHSVSISMINQKNSPPELLLITRK
jgi:tRNA G37 N-methylase Trm5